MDKKSNVLNIIFVFMIIVLIILFVNGLSRKNEINTLINKEDVSNVNDIDTNYIDISNKDESNMLENNTIINNTQSTSRGIDNSTKNKKVISASNKISKKTVDGENFIKIDDLETSNEINVDNQVNMNNLADKFELLARLIYSEAGDEPYMGKIAVGNVVLYRTKENGKSIEDIVYARNQFDGVRTDNFKGEPNEESRKAALEVLKGKEAIKNGYYFANLNLCSPSWAKSETFICRIGDHWFFKKE